MPVRQKGVFLHHSLLDSPWIETVKMIVFSNMYFLSVFCLLGLKLVASAPAPINILECGATLCDGEQEYCESPEAGVCQMCEDLCRHEDLFPTCKKKCYRE